jgi:hypothetical protein
MGEWRADWEERFAALLRDGLPARLSVELSPAWQEGEEGLWILHVHPAADPAMWAPRDFGWPYHLSIAHEGEVTAAELESIRAAFHGRSLTLRFGERAGGYLTVVGEVAAHEALSAAHSRGWYSDRPLHISM